MEISRFGSVLRAQKELGIHIWRFCGTDIIFSKNDEFFFGSDWGTRPGRFMSELRVADLPIFDNFRPRKSKNPIFRHEKFEFSKIATQSLETSYAWYDYQFLSKTELASLKKPADKKIPSLTVIPYCFEHFLKS